jgi:hypothetical protein
LEILSTGGADGNITQWMAEICAFHCDGDTPNFEWVQPGQLPQYSSLQSADGVELDALEGFPTEPEVPADHSGPDRRQLHQSDNDCSHLEGCAICGGEPHFRTFAGDWFDFMGGCDIVLLSSPNFGNGLGLDIHVRTKVRYSYSYIETAVLRLGNDLLEVDSFGAYKVNGVEGAALRKPGLIGFMEGFPIYHTHSKEDTKKHTFDVVLSSNQNITFTTFKDFVSVRPMGGEEYALTGSVGVLGDYNTGLMLGRNGWTIYEDPIEFGLEWQVKDTDPKLFVTDDFPQYPQQCVFPDKATMEKRQLGEAGISRDEAEEACAHHTNAEDRANCVYDVLATGDYEMAKEDYAF